MTNRTYMVTLTELNGVTGERTGREMHTILSSVMLEGTPLLEELFELTNRPQPPKDKK